MVAHAAAVGPAAAVPAADQTSAVHWTVARRSLRATRATPALSTGAGAVHAEAPSRRGVTVERARVLLAGGAVVPQLALAATAYARAVARAVLHQTAQLLTAGRADPASVAEADAASRVAEATLGIRAVGWARHGQGAIGQGTGGLEGAARPIAPIMLEPEPGGREDLVRRRLDDAVREERREAEGQRREQDGQRGCPPGSASANDAHAAEALPN